MAEEVSEGNQFRDTLDFVHDKIMDILDVTGGWMGPMTDEEKLKTIHKIASDAHELALPILVPLDETTLDQG